jgi:hypothetical protein
VDGNTLTYSIVAQPAHGSASVVTGMLAYTPTANYSGLDSFTYKANDGTVDSNTATVSVTVTAVNDAPVCASVTLTTAEDTPGQTAPSCTDVEGSTLTYSIVAQPTHGSASVAAGLLTYTPAANYNGLDSFTYKANDGTVDSNTATVSVTVTAVNDAPVCASVTLTTAEDTPGQTAPSCTDVEGSTLTYSIVAQPTHGSVSVAAGLLTYTPAANYNGLDSFTYKANDGTVDSNTATVSVTVTAVNDAPVCSPVTLTTAEDTPGQTNPSCTDADGNILTYSIVAQPAHGSASVAAGKLAYTPAANYNGADSFTYKANDGTVDSNTATVSVTVTAVNDAPVCSPVTLNTAEDTPGQTNPSCTDADGNILTYYIVAQPAHGSASVAAGKLAYTPAANYNGADSFTYKANDGTADSNTATVSVTVTAVNDAPVCSPVTLTTAEDTPGQTNPSCTDADGNILTYSIVAQPAHGSASVAAGKLAYTPAANYNGADSFTYKAHDGTVDSNTATVSVTVTAVNDAPVCASVTLTTAEDTPGQTNPSCTDVEGNTLTYSIVAQPAHGTASVAAGKLAYTPLTNYNGADSFTYKANDGTVDSNTATVSVTVTAVNDAPVCSSVTLNTVEDTPGQANPSCTDVDGNTLTYSIVAQPAHGSASVVAGMLSYTPTANYSGLDSFTYKANDGTVDSNTATVSVAVTPVNDAPVCSPVTLYTEEDTPGQADPSCTDVDGNTLTYSIVTQAAYGSASVAAGRLWYTPTTSYRGPDSFTYKANDGTVDSNTATISVIVIPIKDPPIIASIDPFIVDAGSPDITLIIIGSNFGDINDTRVRLKGFDTLLIPLQVLSNGISIKITADQLAKPNIYILTVIKSTIHEIPGIPLTPYDQESNPVPFTVFGTRYIYIPIITKNTTH